MKVIRSGPLHLLPGDIDPEKFHIDPPAAYQERNPFPGDASPLASPPKILFVLEIHIFMLGSMPNAAGHGAMIYVLLFLFSYPAHECPVHQKARIRSVSLRFYVNLSV